MWRMENTDHYFFFCLNYTDMRNDTISKLNNIDTHILMYGNSLLTEDENKVIFEAVSQFIIQSK